MFWRFGGYTSISTLEAVLDKPDLTLEELLDESDLIQETKQQNAKLIEYLRDDDVLDKLLKIVIAPKLPEPTSDAQAEEKKPPAATTVGFFAKARPRSDQSGDTDREAYELADKKRLKHAYVACEVLSSEVQSVYDALLEKPETLRSFWDYIKAEPPLDPMQAGYFTRVNEALLEKKTEEMIAFIKSIDNVVKDMMRHVDCPMVMDLLLKLISLEKEPEAQGIVDWLQSQDLIGYLLAYISPNYPAATQTSAGDFLKAVITISANATGQDTSVIGPNELTRQLVSQPCVERLVGEMLKGGNPLTVGVGIVIEVIRKNNSDYDADTAIGPEPRSSDPIFLGTLLRIFSNHIIDFMELILSSKQSIMSPEGLQRVERKQLKTAWGKQIEPLGFDRFKTCELMAELLHCSNMGLLNEKGSEHMVKLRDEQRARLKEEGKLFSASSRNVSMSDQDFSASVDSSGFHHAESFAPLGESPETVKRLEVQNSADDEEFEKVNMSEVSGQSPAKSSDNELASSPNAMQDVQSTDSNSISSFERQDTPDSSSNSTSAASSQSDATPAPLFAHRPHGQAAEPQQPEHEKDQAVPDQAPGPAHEAGQVDHNELSQNDRRDLPLIERDNDGSPVVGDLLKIRFVEHKVVPTILDFFFRFPWNNFLHNVVYDVVQQVFNGAMDRGYNCHLALDVFATGRITEKIVEGQRDSDKAQKEQKMRLGYMGHLTLIAEEVVKFADRQPPEDLSQMLVDKVTSPDWTHYVEHVLAETRDRDNAILGGVRPDVAGGPRQAVLNAVNAAQSGFGNSGSSALANAGLGGQGGSGLDSMDLANAGVSNYGGSLLRGFGGSDDEDDEEMEEIENTATDSGRARRLDDEDQPERDSEAGTGNDGSGEAPVPAPLSVGPSRARLTLAHRLAEKQRRASETEAADEKGDGVPSGIEDEAEDDDESLGGSLRRQTTREAKERRPLDVGDDDDDDDDDDDKPLSPTSQSKIQNEHGATRQREQKRLLQQWGLGENRGRSRQSADDDEDDSDEEDDGVTMGSKYLRRRSSTERGN